MDHTLRIGHLEEAINRCKSAEPFANGVLPTDLRLMAELYGEMIFRRLESINMETKPALLQLVVSKWTALEGCFPRPDPEQACSLRRGDVGFDGCDACQ